MTGLDRELLIEIGCEEIPASWLPGLTAQLGRHLDARLKEFRLTGEGAAETYSTPRRLTARVAKLSERQTDFEELVTGPPVSAAFKPDGQPTPAAIGFAKKYGVEVEALERTGNTEGHLSRLPRSSAREGDRRRAGRSHDGTASRHDVPEADAVGRVPRRRQRAICRLRRPIRWLVLLYGGRVVPFVIRRTELAQGPTVQDIRSGSEHLRPSLPDDQRPRRSRNQGQDVRRLPGAAARELRHPGSRRARAADSSRAGDTRPQARARGSAGSSRRSRRCCRKCRTSSSTRPSSRVTSRSSSSSFPRKC